MQEEVDTDGFLLTTLCTAVCGYLKGVDGMSACREQLRVRHWSHSDGFASMAWYQRVQRLFDVSVIGSNASAEMYRLAQYISLEFCSARSC